MGLGCVRGGETGREVGDVGEDRRRQADGGVGAEGRAPEPRGGGGPAAREAPCDAAAGAPGVHLIDFYPGIYQGQPDFSQQLYRLPQLTYAEDHPGNKIPALRFAFEVTANFSGGRWLAPRSGRAW